MKTLLNQSPFVIHSIMLFVLMMMSASVMATYLMKQQGILIPLMFLSALAFAESVSGMLLVYFKTGFHRSAQLFIAIRVVAVFVLISLFLDLISTDMWVYIAVLSGLVKGLLDSNFAINYEDEVRKNHVSQYDDQYRDIQFTQRTIFSTVRAIWGAMLMGIYGLIDADYITIDVLVALAVVMGVISIVYQTYIYRTYWSKI